jgi:hypothetical protein
MREPIFSRCGKRIGWKEKNGVMFWENSQTPIINSLSSSSDQKRKRKPRIEQDKSLTQLLTGGNL